MSTTPAPSELGTQKARADIDVGKLRMYFGIPSRAHWAPDLSKTMMQHLGVDVVFVGDLVSGAELDFHRAYNATVEAFLDGQYGSDAVKRVWAEVQKRREESHESWLRENAPRK